MTDLDRYLEHAKKNVVDVIELGASETEDRARLDVARAKRRAED